MRLVRKTLLVALGVGLLMLGLVGLVLPVLPGLVLLIGAAACFSLVSPRLKARLEGHLHRNPRVQVALRRWRISHRTLPPWRRAQLAFWLTLRSLLPEPRR